jgi:hypothetical protein
MKRLILCLLLAPICFAACEKEDANLPATDLVMVKFVNQTGTDIEGLVVSKAEVGFLAKGKTTGEYFPFQTLGQQYGFALVEAVGTLDGKKYFTASACQGVCGTESAPDGTWLEPGYYKIAIRIAKNEFNSLEFRMMD